MKGNGAVWLGSTYGTAVSWSDTQLVATVASNSTSGTARVRQDEAWSNDVPFTVSIATISTVTPASGVAGTQVAITGTGFGSAQGTSQVSLSGVVMSRGVLPLGPAVRDRQQRQEIIHQQPFVAVRRAVPRAPVVR